MVGENEKDDFFTEDTMKMEQAIAGLPEGIVQPPGEEPEETLEKRYNKLLRYLVKIILPDYVFLQFKALEEKGGEQAAVCNCRKVYDFINTAFMGTVHGEYIKHTRSKKMEDIEKGSEKEMEEQKLKINKRMSIVQKKIRAIEVFFEVNADLIKEFNQLYEEAGKTNDNARYVLEDLKIWGEQLDWLKNWERKKIQDSLAYALQEIGHKHQDNLRLMQKFSGDYRRNWWFDPEFEREMQGFYEKMHRFHLAILSNDIKRMVDAANTALHDFIAITRPFAKGGKTDLEKAFEHGIKTFVGIEIPMKVVPTERVGKKFTHKRPPITIE